MNKNIWIIHLLKQSKVKCCKVIFDFWSPRGWGGGQKMGFMYILRLALNFRLQEERVNSDSNDTDDNSLALAFHVVENFGSGF